VKNLFRLKCILTLWLSLLASAQRVLVAGVKHPADCEFATAPLIKDLRGIGFPRDWTIVVACNPIMWQKLQRKGNAFGTHTAYTNLAGRVTVVNAEIYRESLPLRGSTHSTPKLVLEHEHGHVVCQCNDEAEADRAAGL
jgi:hypothetical protein